MGERLTHAELAMVCILPSKLLARHKWSFNKFEPGLAKLSLALNTKTSPWPVWLSWSETRSIHQKGVGLIPGQGTYLGCGLSPQMGHVQEATNQCFSLFSPFPI